MVVRRVTSLYTTGCAHFKVGLSFDFSQSSKCNVFFRDPPKTHDDWIKLLQQQETLHSVEIQKWQRILQTAIHLLKQVSFFRRKICFTFIL